MTNEFILRPGEGSRNAAASSPARYLDVVATGHARRRRCCAPWCRTTRSQIRMGLFSWETSRIFGTCTRRQTLRTGVRHHEIKDAYLRTME